MDFNFYGEKGPILRPVFSYADSVAQEGCQSKEVLKEKQLKITKICVNKETVYSYVEPLWEVNLDYQPLFTEQNLWAK